MLLKEITSVYSASHTKAIGTLFGKNTEFMIVKTAGSYSYHFNLKRLKPKLYEIIFQYLN
jgi:hypothetical protein